jgi:hypothetical protein
MYTQDDHDDHDDDDRVCMCACARVCGRACLHQIARARHLRWYEEVQQSGRQDGAYGLIAG